jgi:zinc protease
MRVLHRVVFLSLLALAARPAGAGDPSAYLQRANAALRRVLLDNGMVLLIKEERSAPVAAVQIWVGTGSIHEEQYLGAGLSHYMEHMIFKGTPTRGPADITREIDNAGGDINAYTSLDRTVFHVALPARHWRTAVEVLADAVMNANLPEEEWEREKDVILREMAMGRDDPNRIINKLIFQTAYRVHPYRYPVIGYEEVFQAMTREDLEHFFRRHYVPDNMIVSAVGDFDADEVEAFLREQFAGFQRRPRAPVVIPAEPPQVAPRFARQTGPFQVSRLQWVYPAVALSHPDAPALDVLAQVVGQGRSSRLVQSIQEEQRKVFSIDAWSFTPREAGLFGFGATFEPAREAEVLDAIQAEIDAWTQTPFTEKEVAKARRQLEVDELSELQTARGQAGRYASGEFYAGDPAYDEHYLEAIRRVTPGQLQEVARRYLVPERRALAILSPEPAGAETEAAADPAPAGVAPVQARRLENGITLLVREDHRLPFVHACLALKGGLLSESAENNGITQLTADLLTRGTPTRDARQTAETVERIGATLAPFSGANSFGLQGRALTGDADTLLDLMADCLLHADFPEAELEKQRTVQLAAIRTQQEQPFYLAMQSLRQTLYPDHPYQFDPQGTEATVAALTREAVAAHRDRYVRGGNLVVALFGDITVEEAQRLVEARFESVPAGPPAAFEVAPAQPELPARAVRHEPKEQAILLVGYPGVDVRDPRADALDILQETLSGLSSDLGIEVREKRGLVYFVGAFQRTGLEPGCFVLYAGTRPEAANEVERLIQEQLDRILADGLREEELNRGREQIIARHEMSLQDNGGLAQTCALNELYGLGYDYSFTTEERIRRIGPEQVREAAASIWNPAARAVSLLLPAGAAPREPTAP